jgi:hypothetical protein
MATKKQNPGIPEGTNVTMGEQITAPSLGSSFSPPSQRYIKAIFNEWFALKEQASADLTIYLENPVGVGEHPNISEEIKKKIQEIEKYDSLISTIKNLSAQEEASPTQAP